MTRKETINKISNNILNIKKSYNTILNCFGFLDIAIVFNVLCNIYKFIVQYDTTPIEDITFVLNMLLAYQAVRFLVISVLDFYIHHFEEQLKELERIDGVISEDENKESEFK